MAAVDYRRIARQRLSSQVAVLEPRAGRPGANSPARVPMGRTAAAALELNRKRT